MIPNNIRKHWFLLVPISWLSILILFHNKIYSIFKPILGLWALSFYIFFSIGIYCTLTHINKLSIRTWISTFLIIVIGVIIRLLLIKIGPFRAGRAVDFIESSIPGSFSYYFAGWGIFLSIVFRFIPRKLSNIFLVNSVIGSLTPAALFLLDKEMFGNRIKALFSFILLFTSPLFVIISSSESYTVPAIFFSIVMLIFLFRFFRGKKYIDLIAALAWLGVAVMMRPEYIFLVAIFFVSFFFYNKTYPLKLKIAFMIFLLVFTPYCIFSSKYYFQSSDDIALHGKELDKSKAYVSFPLNYLRLARTNIKQNLIMLFSASQIPLITMILFSISIILMIKKKSKNLLFVAIYFLIIFLMYISMHQESLIKGHFKYTPSLLCPIILGATYSIKWVFGKINGRVLKIAFIVILVLLNGINLLKIGAKFQAQRTTSPDFQEFQLIKHLPEVNTQCTVIGTNDPSLFLYEYEFLDRIKVKSVFELKHISRNINNSCIYFYKGYTPDYYKVEKTKQKFDSTYLNQFLVNNDFKNIFNKSINDQEILIYLKENSVK